MECLTMNLNVFFELLKEEIDLDFHYMYMNVRYNFVKKQNICYLLRSMVLSINNKEVL